MSSEFFVEAVAYQQAAIEEMERRAFSVTAHAPDQGQACAAARGGALHQERHGEIPAARMRAASHAAIWLWVEKNRTTPSMRLCI